MRVLVLGGTGFMGPHLMRELQCGGHQVAVFHRETSPARDGVTHIFGDRRHLRDSQSALLAFRPDVVIDMIAATEQDARELVETFAPANCRLVVISSCDVYQAYSVFKRTSSGAIVPTPLKEDSPLRTELYPYRGSPMQLPYGDISQYDKILVERAVLESTLLTAILRLPMVFGPGDAQHRWFAYLKRMDDHRPFILLDAASARWRGAWGYVENVAAAIALAASRADGYGIYNLADPDSLTMHEWISELAKPTGWSGEILTVPPPCPPPSMSEIFNTAQHLNVDSTRIRRKLGYSEPVSRSEALQRTVEWERAHPPVRTDPADFDYAREDEIVMNAACRRRAGRF